MALEDPCARNKRLKLRLFSGEVLKPALTLLRRCRSQLPHAVHALGEEEATVRIDQPPLPLILPRAEEAGRFEPRPRGPAAKPVPVRRARRRCQRLRLL